MASLNLTQCVGASLRGSASKHLNNANVLMNSANLFYGGPKTGKTTIIAKAFKGTDYIFLDFDNNYDEMQQLIIVNGGKYFNSIDAKALLKQLLLGDITDTVVIIDAMNDVKMMMIDYRLAHLDNTKDSDLITTLERVKKAGIGQFQEPTSLWFTHTIQVMMNNSNSINFIHHTTQNALGEKLEGNKAAYASKFDHVYGIVRDNDKSYFALETARSSIAEETIGMEKSIADATKYMLAVFKDKLINTDGTMTGAEFERAFRNIAKWVVPFKAEVIKESFIKNRNGKKVLWELKPTEPSH